jgi:glycosyltransferase involved in cell wall biosynthesis
LAGQTPHTPGAVLSRALDRLWFRRADVMRRVGLVEQSGLFDAGWYAAQHGKRGGARQLLLDYLCDVSARGIDPDPLFDANWYLSRNSDVCDTGVHPLLHYLQAGGSEGRDPHPLFDGGWYLTQYPDVRKNGVNPLVHYLRVGAQGGCDPHPLFRTRWYLEQYPEVLASGENPLRHYIREGATKGYDPNPLFDSDWYLKVYPDAAEAGLNPLVHYVLHGEAQGRFPSPLLEQAANLEAAGSLTRSDVVWPDRRRETGSRFAGPGGIGIVTELESGKSPSARLEEAVARAASARHHLLVQLTGASLTPEQEAALVRGFAADPMIGAVAPRLSVSPGEVLPLLPAREGARGVDRAVLAGGPQTTLAPDFLPACVLIRRELVANLPKAIAGFQTMRGQLRAMLAWARRAGFRILIDHHVVGTVSSAAQAYPQIGPDERDHLLRLFPDVAFADAQFGRLSFHCREAIAAAALAEKRDGMRRILIDCGGLHVGHSGTSEAIVGILDGVAALDRGWSVTIYASADSIRFHDLKTRYPLFAFTDGKLNGAYAVALRLSQPWLPDDLVTLHRHARKVAVLVLDTIGWDTIYAISTDVETTWRLLAATADGIAHISAFTKDRFNFRFPAAAGALQVVSHLSCHHDDYFRARVRDKRTAGHILLVGNVMEHKGLSAAVEMLPKEFPDETFVAIGPGDGRIGNLTSISSGHLSDQIVEQLHANARMLIYPSFYEGFGFPLVRGLAYGLDVVARRSDLLFEIGAQCERRGRLIPFDDPPSLADAVRAALSGQEVETVPLGTAIPAGGHALRWRDVAARLATMVDDLARDTTLASYDRREQLMRCIPAGRDA